MESKVMKSQYDLSSAVTFLLVGLGLGSVLTILFGPSTEPGRRSERITGWERGETQERLASQAAQVRT
jgi:hypothetical protein